MIASRENPSLVRRIFESIEDGVLVIDRRGRISTWNAAAGRILGVDAPEPDAGLAETLLLVEGLDAFTQAVLDAVSSDAELGRRIVEVETGGEIRTLAVTTTYLRGEKRAGGADGAVVAVFSDLTEVTARRASERNLARQVEAQLEELRASYRLVEERNEALDAMLRKAKVAQIVAAVAVLAVFAGVGAWAWRGEVGAGPAPPPPATPVAETPAGQRTWTVRARPIRLTTSVTGRIAPGAVTNVVSPMAATVLGVHVRDGQVVEAGDLLVDLDASAARRELRAARTAAAEAARRVADLDDWETGREMAAARSRARRAAAAVVRQRRRTEQTAMLIEQGVIAAEEHEAAEEQLEWLLEDRETAIADIAAIRSRGGPQAKDTAALEYASASETLAGLEAAVAAAALRAPVPGMVMAAPGPARSGAETVAAELVAGGRVGEGDLLFRIADVASLAVTGHVSEIEVGAMRVGQAVQVTGAAFHDTVLAGRLSHVAAHGEAAGDGTRFAIRAGLEAVAPDVRSALRVGMSAEIAVVVRDDPSAVVVPIDALRRSGSGYRAEVMGQRDGTVRSVPVETGATTPDGVEIVRGLADGDVLVLPSGPTR